MIVCRAETDFLSIFNHKLVCYTRNLFKRMRRYRGLHISVGCAKNSDLDLMAHFVTLKYQIHMKSVSVKYEEFNTS